MVLLATAATVIASQAVITGAYSLTRQAIQLGLLPRLEIRHTSESLFGQIYMPRVNTLLAGRRAAAGGAVPLVERARLGLWHRRHRHHGGHRPDGDHRHLDESGAGRLAAALALMLPFLFIDLTFLAANMLKIVEGGWMPLALGAVVMTMMYTWRRGSRLLILKTRKSETPLDFLVANLEKKPPIRVPGTAVFLTSDPDFAPTALMHSLKHYKVLHEKNVILTIETADTPRVDPAERVRIEPVGQTFSRVVLRFGFMETPERAEGLGDRAQARLAVRHHVDVVLPVAPLAQAGRPFRHAALAGPAVHRADPLGQRRHRLFPDSDRAGGGSRDAGHGLKVWCSALRFPLKKPVRRNGVALWPTKCRAPTR